jgi:hypothetical protein
MQQLTREQVQARFGVTRPDEAAECWDGVCAVPGLYEALWGLVELYTSPSPEESEEPCVGEDSIADFWDKLSPEHQQALARLEAENSAAWGGADDAVGMTVSNRFAAGD